MDVSPPAQSVIGTPAPVGQIEALAQSVLAGDRRALARAITLVESARPDHREQARALVAQVAASGRQAILGSARVMTWMRRAFAASFAALGLRLAMERAA